MESNPEDRKPAVPKFSSFQPKKTRKSPSLDAKRPRKHHHGHRDEKRAQRSDDRYEKDLGEHNNQNAGPERKDTLEGPLSVRRGRHSGAVAKVQIRSHDATSRNIGEQIWISDRRGDPLNETYQSLHQSDVPRYRRIGFGRVLGTRAGVKINRDESNEKRIVLDVPDRFDYPSRSVLSTQGKSIPKRPQHIVADKTPESSMNHASSFISLKRTRKRKRSSEDLPSDEAHAIVLREGAAISESDLSHSDSESDLEPERPDDFEDAVTRQRNLELTRLTKDEPRNLQGWRDLIKHQEDMIMLGRPKDVALLNASEKRSLADIKVSIYKEALIHLNGDIYSQEELWIGLLNEGESLWEDTLLQKYWKEAVESLQTSIRVRIGYINFLQTNSTSFRFEQCKAEYLKCLELLQMTYSSASNPEARSRVVFHQAYVFLRLTAFLKQSGYHELSTALWQAALEFVILRPPDLSNDDAFADFEEYWDSESYRLGEVLNSGWRNRNLPEPFSYQTETVSAGSSIFAQFVQAELNSEKSLYIPGRTIDDAGEDDPFHIILFSDISPFLYVLLTSLDLVRPLTYAFLCYAGLPPLEGQSETLDYGEWWLDPFLHIQAVNLWDKPFKSNEGIQSLPACWRWSRMTTDLLFSGVFPDILNSNTTWTQMVLRQLVYAQSEWSELAEYLVAFLLKYSSPEDAAKEAKQLLKKRKSSLRLYNAFGLIEYRRNRTDAADKVLSTAINMSKTLASDDINESILLWRTWIWENIRRGSINRAIHLLLSLTDKSVAFSEDGVSTKVSFTPGTVLKSRQIISDGIERCLVKGSHGEASLYVEVLALFTYFQDEQKLSSAMDVFQQSEKRSHPQDRGHLYFIELLHQARASFIMDHTLRSKTYKPLEVKLLLIESIRHFPHNTIFLSSYAHHELSFGLNDRLRTLLFDSKYFDTQDTLVYWLVLLWIERRRLPELGGTSHAILSLLERAIGSKSSKHSMALWTTYLYFEKTRRDDETLKRVIHRGLSSLPWAKSFIMLGLSILSYRKAAFGDLRSLYQVLEDRELRIHVNIAEELHEMETAGTQRL